MPLHKSILLFFVVCVAPFHVMLRTRLSQIITLSFYIFLFFFGLLNGNVTLWSCTLLQYPVYFAFEDDNIQALLTDIKKNDATGQPATATTGG